MKTKTKPFAVRARCRAGQPDVWMRALSRLVAACFVVPTALFGAVETFTFTGPPLSLTPIDAQPAGVVDVRTVSSSIGTLTDVNVYFRLVNPEVAGANNGDYLVTLSHEGGYSVLVNRVGRKDGADPTSTFGYSDNGFSVTLDDDAPAGDIHAYRLQLAPGGSHETPVDPGFLNPLTGVWAPDGRHPLDGSLASTTRTAMLGQFVGKFASGEWSLFVADLNGGGTANLVEWSLTLTGTAIPEPAPMAAVIGLTCSVWVLVRRVIRGTPPLTHSRKPRSRDSATDLH